MSILYGNIITSPFMADTNDRETKLDYNIREITMSDYDNLISFWKSVTRGTMRRIILT